MRYFGLLFSFAAFCVSLQPTNAQAQTDNLIVPGVRIGPVNLGISDTAVYNKFGNPTSTSYDDNDATINHFYPTFIVTIDRDSHKVIQVTTSDPRYATDNGIKVGISNLAAATKLGIPPANCDRQVGCNYRSEQGLWLDVKGDQSVRSIWVVPAGK
jgi:hypothetical protein